MAVSITSVPAEPRAVIDICRIDISGADYARDPDGTGGQFTYRIVAERPAGAEHSKPLQSEEFNVSHDGDHSWQSLIFEESGDWTLKLVDTADDSVVASTTVTVS